MKHLTLSIVRLVFILSSSLLAGLYACTLTEFETTTLILGLVGGAIFGLALVNIEKWLGSIDFRTFNTILLGLFVGYLLGWGLTRVLDAAIGPHLFGEAATRLVHLLLYLVAIYLGIAAVIRTTDEFYVSIPFIRLQPTSTHRKDILLDASALADPRIIDLAGSGLLDQQLLLPRFILKELLEAVDSPEEITRNKARRTLEVVRKLETLASVGLRYLDTDFPEIKEPLSKMVRMARFCDANVLTADIARVQQMAIEGVKFINIHTLSNALKPLMQTAEVLEIKIQRYGKEARQGVGYLDDGTMVVVNGGGDFIGETIKAQVLSVKHTTSGRMIFCNALEGMDRDADLSTQPDPKRETASASSSYRDYFLV